MDAGDTRSIDGALSTPSPEAEDAGGDGFGDIAAGHALADEMNIHCRDLGGGDGYGYGDIVGSADLDLGQAKDLTGIGEENKGTGAPRHPAAIAGAPDARRSAPVAQRPSRASIGRE